MKIRELTVNNFRGFSGETRFQLAEHFTVIAGINGRGKTALLDGLALLISRLFRTLALSAGNQRTISSTDVYSGAQDASLAMKANCAGIPVKYEVSFRADAKTARATSLSSTVKRQIVSNYGDPARRDDQAPVAVYFTTDRAGMRLPRTLPSDLPSGQKLAHHGALSNRMVDYRGFMARYRTWAATGGSRELGAFNRALAVFLGDFHELAIEENPLRLTILKGKTRLSLQQLSDGERAFLALLGDLVRRLALANPDLENPLDGHGVVLVDELELHLHPRWQREVAEKLRSTFPNIQFIATTHSPFVIQSLRAGELINLDPDEIAEYANRSVEDIAENVMGVEVPQKSERYLEMMRAAEEFYKLLQGQNTSVEEIAAAEKRLDELSMRFGDDPAFYAFLKLELEAKRAEAIHAAG